MKPSTTILAAILITLSVNVFAADEPVKDAKKVKATVKVIKAPALVWGDPMSVFNVKITEPTLASKFPELVWGSPEDVNDNAIAELNKISFPDFEWGNPEEID